MPSAGVKKTQSLAAVKSKKGAKAVKPGFSYGTMQ
eukprot:CAMPEP_0184295336 /NCGR_PEP_ID=MMETSP1049-20130417/6208_1 /TAXON_ID=77928 /ORGANISM="Proteomonas sulcata, Strain CCMP704" /LENGTH=34 /DNA_ID= /DNA_START= /DNA_END= /DNA_ORIENTATION=